ncbi:hypothetical protein KBC04_02060 [Candidatus Babeliales bacterium]|nr:hypothetical protein [Candidatus Babeliales bacterium]MBP9843806.1 hypothetical protein [Candidatus Babeliales bacterium]
MKLTILAGLIFLMKSTGSELGVHHEKKDNPVCLANQEDLYNADRKELTKKRDQVRLEAWAAKKAADSLDDRRRNKILSLCDENKVC